LHFQESVCASTGHLAAQVYLAALTMGLL
jgi:hypothetical protein